VRLGDPIREVGTHRVMVKLHSDVEFPVNLEVVG
jgi:ribosomal protein L9